jgi:hypothetical protein
MTAPITSNTRGVNILTALGKAIVGERSRPFGEPLGVDPATSTLIFDKYDAVLVDAMPRWLRPRRSRTALRCITGTWRPSPRHNSPI